ncbi:two-component response regulator-like APRR7 isoform X1 [Pistacia vera]|uniref:two-component response regulator-like APRR7 isoform X1 n=2 Tax=Pistacia vera TaxID=55513 RepID=UPI001262AFF2|nr:two-component response regulator-like APRR7 isoform X1 [Pistacia vera]XP_031250108.1 two-component response regulator-like APRR7 isoform X1 [Pistacia vera]
MELIQMNDNGPMTNGLAELNHCIRDERKEIRDGVAGEGQGLSEEDESGINEDLEDVNDGWVEAVQAHAQAVLQRPQQQPQGPLVCWERFLPLRSLKVLLVENDDSTRCVVCALLRNCGYEVVAVENGLEAWKILEDLTNQIDLILTEVVMPCLSGIGLLHKIMSHKTCKNIPVIMMSSNDSMSVVFKCLSKGAVHFLGKPIRKNELQNFWQHVWRKCQSSSGSGTESGIMTEKSTKSKNAEESDNNSGSYGENDIGSIGLNIRDGSDNGSGNQSSRMKGAAEVESLKPMSPGDQLADPLDRTCAQVILSRPEAFGNSWVPTTTTREHEKQDDEHDHIVMGKDLELGVPRIPNLQLEDPTGKELNNIASINKEKISEMNYKKDDEQQKKNQLELNCKKPNGDLRNQVADQMGVITNSIDSTIEDVVFDITNGLFKVSGMKEKAIYEHNELPGLELSLKRRRDTGDTETGLHERNVLRHSDEHSAFSRYTSASTANQVPTGNVGSNSLLDNSSEAAKTESIQVQHHHHLHHVHNMLQQQLANQDDSLLKTMATAAAPQCGSSNGLSAPIEGNTGNHSLNGSTSGSNHGSNGQNGSTSGSNHGSNGQNGSTSGSNHGSNGQNGSTSGSYHGSNGQNGSSLVVNARGINVESDNGLAAESGASGGIGYASSSGVEKNRFAQREAVLNKFRQKRKKRCFEKKVRYHSRKKMAEQRPRVRGQFVKQVLLENKYNDADS